jgi:hypothetical protein
MTLAITMASDDVLGELRISISLVLAQARHLSPECSDFVHLPWSSEVIRGHQEASALAHSGCARATCSMVPNYLPNYTSHTQGAPVPRVAWSPSYSQFAISGNQWPSVPITCATCSMVPFFILNLQISGHQWPSEPITCATCSLVHFLFSICKSVAISANHLCHV